MIENRISTCTSDFGCLLNPFYVLDRMKDPFQSSSGIDVNSYEFNKYENFDRYKNESKKCNNVLNINLIILISIILLLFFIIYKLK